MSRYSAQKQFWKAKQAKHEKDKIADVVLLQKLQVRDEHTFLHTHLKGSRWFICHLLAPNITTTTESTAPRLCERCGVVVETDLSQSGERAYIDNLWAGWFKWLLSIWSLTDVSCLTACVQPGAETERDRKQESPRRRGQIRDRHAGERLAHVFLQENKYVSCHTSDIHTPNSTKLKRVMVSFIVVQQWKYVSAAHR